MPSIRVILALAISIPLGGPAFAGDAALAKQFAESSYTLCDAHFVSKTFGFAQQEAKEYIGQKIAWGTTDILDEALAEARKKGQSDRLWRCQFYQTGYTPEDAEALSQYWGIGVSEAKVRVEDKILSGNESFLREAVLPGAKEQYYANLAGPDAASAEPDPADMKAWFTQSKYDACHAKMLVGTYFGSSLRESKGWIGHKLRAGWTDQIEAELDGVRKRHQDAGTQPCTFAETRWTTADATALAKLWGQSVADAQTRMADKYVWGSESIVEEELGRARRP